MITELRKNPFLHLVHGVSGGFFLLVVTALDFLFPSNLLSARANATFGNKEQSYHTSFTLFLGLYLDHNFFLIADNWLCISHKVVQIVCTTD